MPIGTAAPTQEELNLIPHHFIGSRSIHDPEYNAGMYAREASELVSELFRTFDTLILVGGSTLYSQALLEGIDEMPDINPELRASLNSLWQYSGIEVLQEELLQADPEYYQIVDVANPIRLIRALEIIRSSGRTYTSFRQKSLKVRDYALISVVLSPEREDLYRTINLRCHEMLEAGLLAEVASLYPFRELKAVRTIGYTEYFDYMDGKTSLEEAGELFRQHTRNYAKRQLTWFRKQSESHPFATPDEAFAYISGKN